MRGWLLWLCPCLLWAGEPPQRVVSLAPHLSEWVVALGAQARLVGAMTPLVAGTPAQAVGDANGISREVLLALQPDLVLTWPSGNRADDLAWIAARVWPVFAADTRAQLNEVPALLRHLGLALGVAPRAEALALAWNQQLTQLQQQYTAAKPVTVLYQIWPEPLLTLNDQHLIGDALRLCGGRNIFGALPILAPQLAWESVIAADPEVILVAVDTGQSFAALSAVWARWPKLQAVRQQRIYPVAAATLHRPGPTLLTGVAQLCQVLAQARSDLARATP